MGFDVEFATPFAPHFKFFKALLQPHFFQDFYLTKNFPGFFRTITTNVTNYSPGQAPKQIFKENKLSKTSSGPQFQMRYAHEEESCDPAVSLMVSLPPSLVLPSVVMSQR